MPRIKAFKALRPVPEAAADVASVPYDVVNRSEAASLAEGNPLSFLHVVRAEIDLPESTSPYSEDVYKQAAKALAELQSGGHMQQDSDDTVFLYRQVMDGRSQVGLVCCCHVDDYENNLILKHEKTRPDKEDDRTNHLLAVNAHVGPVFLTYRDVDVINRMSEEAVAEKPLYDFTAPDGVQHTVWRVSDPAPFVQALSAVPVFYVADGHHRSASAWRAGAERRKQNSGHTGDEEYNWFLSVLFPAGELSILAYNRIIADLNGLTAEQLGSRLGEIGVLEPTNNPVPEHAGQFCIYFDETWHKLTVPAESIDREDPIESLDVAILERRILEPIFGITDVRTDKRIDFVGGIRGTAELEKRVNSGDWACAVSMYPTSIEQLMAVSDAGKIMPPKSTWFEPKLRSGLLVHLLD